MSSTAKRCTDQPERHSRGNENRSAVLWVSVGALPGHAGLTQTHSGYVVGVALNTGICRSVLDWYSTYGG